MQLARKRQRRAVHPPGDQTSGNARCAHARDGVPNPFGYRQVASDQRTVDVEGDEPGPSTAEPHARGLRVVWQSIEFGQGSKGLSVAFHALGAVLDDAEAAREVRERETRRKSRRSRSRRDVSGTGQDTRR